jgi:hypothetical protein
VRVMSLGKLLFERAVAIRLVSTGDATLDFWQSATQGSKIVFASRDRSCTPRKRQLVASPLGYDVKLPRRGRRCPSKSNSPRLGSVLKRLLLGDKLDKKKHRIWNCLSRGVSFKPTHRAGSGRICMKKR